MYELTDKNALCVLVREGRYETLCLRRSGAVNS